MRDLYSVKEASALTGIARPTLRTYTVKYARHLSTEATPEPGKERRFTEADLRLLAFVYQYTDAGETHEQVIDRLAAGELERFAWSLPDSPESPPSDVDAPESASTALVPIERYAAVQTLLQDAQRREREALDKLAAAEGELRRLERELGAAQGRLSAQYRAPTWWRRLFGGSQ